MGSMRWEHRWATAHVSTGTMRASALGGYWAACARVRGAGRRRHQVAERGGQRGAPKCRVRGAAVAVHRLECRRGGVVVEELVRVGAMKRSGAVQAVDVCRRGQRCLGPHWADVARRPEPDGDHVHPCDSSDGEVSEVSVRYPGRTPAGGRGWLTTRCPCRGVVPSQNWAAPPRSRRDVNGWAGGCLLLAGPHPRPAGGCRLGGAGRAGPRP